jgi:hypothetical protein
MTDSADDGGRNAGTFGALLGLVALAWLLLGLVAMVLPQILGLVVVLGGFLGIVSLHYLLWGCWLSRLLIEEQRREEAQSAQDARG